MLLFILTNLLIKLVKYIVYIVSGGSLYKPPIGTISLYHLDDISLLFRCIYRIGIMSDQT
nr:MAG TPA: hypothetical protein [Myoviridae sp. ctRUJ25]DAY32598.1 MAG TPA: hypothetical protein [Caudoviricetes sp.]